MPRHPLPTRPGGPTRPESPVQPAAATWPGILTRLIRGDDLDRATAAWAMDSVVGGVATTAQIAGFVTALRAKGESVDELAGFVDALLDQARTVPVAGPTVDIAGTGGDGTGAVNVSTLAAVVAAATGPTVVKHGGRSASSRTAGSADLAERLGVNLELGPAEAARVAAEAGLVFLFAPRFSPGLRHAVDARRDLAVPTVFNLVAPLINPARPTRQVVGVADGDKVALLADVLARRGGTGLVVHGRDGLDNLTTVTRSDVCLVRDGTVTATTLDPADLGLPPARPADLRGGDADHNAAIAVELFRGRRGPVRDVVLLNAAAVVTAATLTAAPLLDQLRAALHRCAAAVDSGAARAVLERLVRVSHAVR